MHTVEERYLLNESELQSRLATLLGGRVAEALSLGEVSTGAADDLSRATDLARRMVTEFGMSPAIGPVRLAGDPQQSAFLGWQQGLDARVSPQTAAQVDAETCRLIETAASRAGELLQSHKSALDELASRLYEQETVDGDEVIAILEQVQSGNGYLREPVLVLVRE